MAKRVLYVVPPGNDLGGIITSSEHLMIGLREAGYEAEFALLRSGRVASSVPRGRHANDFVVGEGSGLMMHPLNGWRGPAFTTDVPEDFLAYANTFDVVIFGCMYGLNNDKTQGLRDWTLCVTGIKPPVVFMVRDDHLEVRTPWVMAFAPYVAAWAGVQECSFDSCLGLGAPVGLVYSGHALATPGALESKRQNAALALATWKPWKQGRKLLMTAPHMKTKLFMAGDGIDLRYMRSPDKARDRDFYPDGRRIWDVAMKTVDYLGPIGEAERDRLMTKVKLMIDFSYRENSGQINRVVVEAMRHGAVPVCDPMFISGNVEGVGRVFEAGRDYLPIRTRLLDEKLLAQNIDQYAGNAKHLAEIRAHNLSRVPEFSRATAAANLVKLAQGKRAGLLYDNGKRADREKLARGEAAFANLFGGDVP